MFINISNHHSDKWGKEQKEEAFKWGNCNEIIDLGFPNIPSDWDETELKTCVSLWENIISDNTKGEKQNRVVIHLMGETGFICGLFRRLFHNSNFTIVHSTTERIVVEKDGQKVSTFKFCKFRETI